MEMKLFKGVLALSLAVLFFLMGYYWYQKTDSSAIAQRNGENNGPSIVNFDASDGSVKEYKSEEKDTTFEETSDAKEAKEASITSMDSFISEVLSAEANPGRSTDSEAMMDSFFNEILASSGEPDRVEQISGDELVYYYDMYIPEVKGTLKVHLSQGEITSTEWIDEEP